MKTRHTYLNRRRHTALMMGEAGIAYLAFIVIAGVALMVGLQHATAEALSGLVAVLGG